MLFSFQAQNTRIKQELPTEPTFTDKFLSIMSKLELEHSISKDSIFQLVRLFYENNSLFLELFEKCFLLVFETYSSVNGRSGKSTVQQIVKGYSEFINLFLIEMIEMESEVKKRQEQQDYFDNFLNFYLRFFAEGLSSGQSFIKQFCFTVINSSLKIIEQKFLLELSLESQNQLLDSTFYLLASKHQDFKRMGIELYANLKKVRITSQEINELLMEYLEELQNYSLRKMIIRWGVEIKKQRNLDRFLNRLKDKNPLIVQEVIQKLISEKVSIQDWTFDNKIKLIVDGYRSAHTNIKNKTLQYLSDELLKLWKQKQEVSVQIAVPKQNISMSVSVSNIEENKKQTSVQRLIRIFNYDDFRKDRVDLFRENPFMSSLICQLIYEVACSSIPFGQLKQEVSQIFKQIQISLVSSEQCIFLYSLLTGIHTNGKNPQSNLTKNQKDIKELICTSIQNISPNAIITCLKRLMKQQDLKKLTTKYYFIKIIQLISVHLDLYDCVGKRIIFQGLRKILTQVNFFEPSFRETNIQSMMKESQKLKQNDKSFYLELIKANQLINLEGTFTGGKLEVITSQGDLIFSIVDLIHLILIREPSCQAGELKLLVDGFIQNKELIFKRETIKSMYLKTSEQIKVLKNKNQQDGDNKQLLHLIDISKEIQKKIRQNEKKIIANTLKGFFILVKILLIKKSQGSVVAAYLNEFKASNYIESLKNYLYKVADVLTLKKQDQLETFYIPYVLLYHYCSESVDNFSNFKKLFFYYAFQQAQSLGQKDHLLKLVSCRILVELEINNCRDKSQVVFSHQQHNLLQKNMFNLLENISCDPRQQHFLQQIILKIACAFSQQQSLNVIFSKLLIFVVKQYVSQTFEGNFSRILLFVFQSISQLNTDSVFKIVLLFYQAFNKLINDPNVVLKKEGKCFIISDISKLLNNLIKISTISEDHLTNNDQISSNFTKLTMYLRILQSSANPSKYLLPPLIKVNEFVGQLFSKKAQSQHLTNHFNFKQIETQLLIFIKSQLDKFLQKLHQRKTYPCASTENDFIHLSQCLQILELSIGEEISKRLSPQESNLYEQQSTDHSPILNNDKNQKASSKNIRIDFDKIDSYKGQLSTQITQLNQKSDEIYNELKDTHVYQSLCKDFAYFIANKKIYNPTIQAVKPNQIKLQDENIVQSDILLDQNAETNKRSVEFDRKGRRKHQPFRNSNEKSFILRASIKRSQYIIIPYDLIQAAEEKYSMKKKSEKGSRKYTSHRNNEKDQSYRSYWKPRNSLSQQLSNCQTSRQQDLSTLNEIDSD